jgi:hypothetical protein
MITLLKRRVRQALKWAVLKNQLILINTIKGAAKIEYTFGRPQIEVVKVDYISFNVNTCLWVF